MREKTAPLFGASGLVGSFVLKELLKDESFSGIHVFSRKKSVADQPKITEHIIDFNSLENYSDLIKGDVLFCCLGTTIRKAGSQEAFRKVDFNLPVQLAQIASGNKVKKFIVISSLGADAKSSNFYLRTKGEMENEIQKYKFQQISILRPSMLLGARQEFRFGELIGKGVIQITGPLLFGKLKKYRGIHAATVAKAMIKIAKENTDKIVFESDELQKIGR